MQVYLTVTRLSSRLVISIVLGLLFTNTMPRCEGLPHSMTELLYCAYLMGVALLRLTITLLRLEKETLCCVPNVMMRDVGDLLFRLIMHQELMVLKDDETTLTMRYLCLAPAAWN